MPHNPPATGPATCAFRLHTQSRRVAACSHAGANAVICDEHPPYTAYSTGAPRAPSPRLSPKGSGRSRRRPSLFRIHRIFPPEKSPGEADSSRERPRTVTTKLDNAPKVILSITDRMTVFFDRPRLKPPVAFFVARLWHGSANIHHQNFFIRMNQGPVHISPYYESGGRGFESLLPRPIKSRA